MPPVRISLLIPLLVCCCAPLMAAPVPWLFDVEVSVPDRSPAARRAAEQRALEIVLQRVTGLDVLPESDVLSEAREHIAELYSQYGYVTRPAAEPGAEPALEVEFRFDRGAVQRLAAEAGLGLWSLSRPLVVVWIAEQGTGAQDLPRRRLLASGDADPVVLALVRRARERGLPLLVPVMDFEDRAEVTAVDVWGRFQDTLARASQRYGADLVASGRLWQNVFGGWHADWQVTGLDEDMAFADDGLDAPSLAMAFVDQLTARLAARFAIDAGDEGQGPWPIEIRVAGLTRFADYAAVLRLLGNLEAVQGVEVTAADRGGFHFRVQSAAPAQRLAEILALDRRLSVAPGPRSTTTLNVRWHGAE